MNIGGRAFSNGIMLESDNFSVKVTRKKENIIDINVNTLNNSSKKTRILFKNLPFLRGISNYFSRKINRIMVLLFVFSDILRISNINSNVSNSALSISLTLILNIIFVSFVLYCIVYGRRILQNHGAEHKVVNTYESNQEIIYDNVKKANRINYRCGTIYVIFLIIPFVILNLFIKYYSLNYLIAIGISYELFRSSKLENGILKFIYQLGGWIQKYVTTLEPKDNQIEIAIICINKILELEKKE